MKKLCWTTIDENILNEAKRTGFRLNELLILGLKEVKKMGKTKEELIWIDAKRKFDSDVVDEAKRLVEKAMKDRRKAKKLKEKQIESVIASAIYVASKRLGKKITQEDIWKKANVSPTTIRGIYRLLE
jgi:transcription initiation factor TFIIIB Brf1 subunit/transcription initiation factor TFIIB